MTRSITFLVGGMILGLIPVSLLFWRDGLFVRTTPSVERITPSVEITDAIERAQAAGELQKVIKPRAEEIGLNCGSRLEICEKLIVRADKNPLLKQAFLRAKAKDVLIFPYERFSFFVGDVGKGYVDINILYDDEKIITFLGGK